MQLSVTTLYKNHGAKIGYWTGAALATVDGAEVRLTYAKTMDGKPVTKVDPIVGKNIGRANETTPQQQAVLDFTQALLGRRTNRRVRLIPGIGIRRQQRLGFRVTGVAEQSDGRQPLCGLRTDKL